MTGFGGFVNSTSKKIWNKLKTVWHWEDCSKKSWSNQV